MVARLFSKMADPAIDSTDPSRDSKSRVLLDEEKANQTDAKVPKTAERLVSDNELTTQAVGSHAINLSGWRLAIVTGSLCLGTLLVAIDTTIISVAIPRISTDFKNIDDIGWYGSAYLLTVTAFQPAFGSIYKFFDAKTTYLISIFTFEGGLAHGVLHSPLKG